MKDALLVCVDGLKGFPEAIEAVPSTLVQTCIVHLIRASLKFVTWKERKALAADLKLIYRAATAEMAELALAEFRVKYPKHQVVADVWSRNWQHVIPFFEFPEEIRKIIYTTNAVESLHMTLRKVTKNRGSFPTQESAIKLLYLGCRNVSKKWSTVQGGPRPFASLPSAGQTASIRLALRREKSNLSNNMGIAFTQSPCPQHKEK